MILETKRMNLRPIVAGDDADIYAYSKNPNVGPIAGWAPHKSISQTREIMKEVFLNQEDVFGMILRETGRLIGTIGLLPDPMRPNPDVRLLGYAMAEEYWGNGLMTEAAQAVITYAFQERNLSLISITCFPENNRSRRVIEKCGFAYEGRLRQCEKLFDGTVHDYECFSMLRP